MVKKVVLPTLALCLTAVVGFTAFGIWKSVSSRPTFPMDGYVLRGDGGEVKQLGFQGQESYQISRAGQVIFRDADGERAVVRRDSFVHLNDGSVMALCDGVLLDFNDLSENFINNYFITAKLPIAGSAGIYTAETNSGTVNFGENLWKLSEEKYIVRSPELTIRFGDDDERPAGEYVQVTTTPDGIVQLLTAENLWTTISPECYIQTQSGIKVFPVTQIVDNGTNKLSLAKISVNADDSIVLTESETRRQIVPELNIDTIDGEDGADGDAGQNGEQGVAGEKGIDGEKGADGEQGIPGEDGEQGAAGQQGTTGQTGANGQEGSAGASGAAGAGGQNGGRGGDGYDGQAGNSATVQSSTNVALPVMTFTDWNVTATSLSGKIEVTDDSNLLEGIDLKPTVTVYEVDTGRSFPCFARSGGSLGQFEFQDGAEPEFVVTDGAGNITPLTPDTNYRISVVAYYKMSDKIYSREFISRFFYTDSTGLHLSYVNAGTTFLGVNGVVANDYRGPIQTAYIYLLTPDQNQKVTSKDISDFTARYIVYYKQKQLTYNYIVPGSGAQTIVLQAPSGDNAIYDMPLSFGDVVTNGTNTGSPLSTNQKYILRVVVNTDGMEVLTNQALEVTTLRRNPDWDKTKKPEADFNRVTGAFEVYRPAVADPDSGVTRYIYTAKQYNANTGVWEPVPGAQKILLPSETGPASFFLPSGTSYKFQVEMEFNDNEKTVSYDLGESEEVKYMGETLPGLTWSELEYGTEYSSVKGDIIIGLEGNRTLTVEPGRPLELRVYADQIYNSTVELKKVTEPFPFDAIAGQSMGTATLSKLTSNEAIIHLDLDNLCKNTRYTVAVYGYLNLQDDNGSVRRAIGTASFDTLQTLGVTAKWEITGDDSATISANLKLSLVEPNTSDETLKNTRLQFAEERLEQGQIDLKLSRGSGPNRSHVITKFINSTTTVKPADLFSDAGVTIDDNLFGVSLVAGDTYTIEVEKIADQTYSMGMSYINTFDVDAATRTQVITGQKTPPALIRDPENGVLATPILNADAGSYGGRPDSSLPDDAVVGYTLEAQYDNSLYLAKSVTYYPFEYSVFYRALDRKADPVRMQMDETGTTRYTVIDPITLNFAAGSATAPKLALLFGGKAGDPVGMAGQNYYNGYYSYYAGTAEIGPGGVLTGMGRGYRYVFAYTVEWSQSVDSQGSTQTYPYQPSSNYNSARDNYGAGLENGFRLGQRVAYILNSGMQSVPRITPEFHTYVSKTTDETWQSNGTTAGKLELHYAWRDKDSTIRQTAGGGNEATQITWGAFKQELALDPVNTPGASLQWYRAVIPYEADGSDDNVVAPTVDVSLYGIDYRSILTTLGISLIEEKFCLCEIPVEQSFGNYFTGLAGQGQNAYVQMDLHLDENYIDFILPQSENFANMLGGRACSMRLELSREDGVHIDPIYLPVSYRSGSGYYARLSSGALPMGSEQKSFTVKATVLYDTGSQGWCLIEDIDSGFGSKERSSFALQQVTKSTDNPYRLGSYLTGSTYGSRNNSVVQQIADSGSYTALTTEKIRGLVKSNESNDASAMLSVRSFASASTWNASWQLYPIQQGVSMMNRADKLEEIKERGTCAVPKQVAEQELTFLDGNDFKLTKIIPTIQRGGFTTSQHGVDAFSGTHKIWSHTQAGREIWEPSMEGSTLPPKPNSYVLHALLFDSESKAQNFANNPSALTKDEAIENSEVTIRLNETSGTPIDDEYRGVEPNRVRVTGVIQPKDSGGNDLLQENGVYYLVFYMIGADRSIMPLIDYNTAAKAVYPVETASGVQIRSDEGLNYNATSYFTQNLELKYSVNRSSNVTMKFSLYDVDPEANKNAKPIYTDEELREKGLLSARSVNLSTAANGNTAIINLSPSPNRNKIVPGYPYYLKLDAYDGTSLAGTEVFMVKAWSTANVGALIYVTPPSEKNAVAFTVTVNNPSCAIMGHDKLYESKSLFAVRFTDSTGRWIPTTYDGKVYYANDPKQVFELNAQTITWPGYKIDPSETYSINIYAVVDKDQDGFSELVPIPGDAAAKARDYTDFFGDTDAAEQTLLDKFQAFLSQFWGEPPGAGANDLRPNKAEMDRYESGFRVGRGEQRPTGADGIYVNTSKATIYRRGSSVILSMSESIGLIQHDDSTGEDKQMFKAVEWQVQGQYNSANGVENIMQRQLTPTSKTPIQAEKDASGYDLYTYTIPADIPSSGTYDVVIRLCKNVDGTEDSGDVMLSGRVYT